MLHRNLLSTALRCSSTALISCKLELVTVDPESTEHIVALLQGLLQTSNRWQSLDIDMIGQVLWNILLPLKNNLAMLQTLTIYFNSKAESPETKASLSSLFSCASRLSDVRFSLEEFLYDLPFGQIRKLAITTIPSDEDSVRLVPYLTKISTSSPDFDTLEIKGYFPYISTSQSPIHFPRLRKLSVHNGDMCYKLVQVLHLPALKSLYILSDILHGNIDILLDLISRCRCDVRTLSLEFRRNSQRNDAWKPPENGVLQATLALHVPKLEELHLEIRGLYDSSSLETFIRFIEAPDCLPQLRALSIVGRFFNWKDNGNSEEVVLPCVRRLAIIEEVVRTRSEWCTKGLDSISVSLMVDNSDKEHDMHKSRSFLSQLPSFRAMASMAPSVSLSLLYQKRRGKDFESYLTFDLTRQEMTLNTSTRL